MQAIGIGIPQHQFARAQRLRGIEGIARAGGIDGLQHGRAHVNDLAIVQRGGAAGAQLEHRVADADARGMVEIDAHVGAAEQQLGFLFIGHQVIDAGDRGAVSRVDLHAGYAFSQMFKLDLSIANLFDTPSYWSHIGKNSLAVSDIVNSGTTSLVTATVKF